MAKKEFVQNDNNHAIAYYRYSSESQNELSIEQQREAAQRYAKGKGYIIVREYEDKAVSGTTDERPGFQLMLHEVDAIRPAVCITYATNRIARDRAIAAIAKMQLRNAGCRLEYVAEALPEDADSPEYALMEGLFETYAEYYSKKLSQDIRRGVHFNADHALYNGRKILGYRGEKGRPYEIGPDSAAVVQRIFNDYADGKPMKSIVDDLNAQGVQTSQGGRFTVNGLRSVLHNEAYLGIYRYSGRRIEGGMPAIIDPDLFERVCKQLASNKRTGPQRARRSSQDEAPQYWLTGKLYCGKCGCGMRGTHGTSKTGAKYYYYICAGHQRHECDKRNVRKATVEDVVKELLSSLLDDSELLASFAADAAAYYRQHHNDIAYLDSLTGSLDETQKAINNLVRALEQGIFSESTQARLTELEERKCALIEAIDVEDAKLRFTQDERTIGSFFNQYAHANLEDPKVRDEILDYFIDKIFLYDNHLTIVGWFTDGERYERDWQLGDFDVGFEATEFEPLALISTT